MSWYHKEVSDKFFEKDKARREAAAKAMAAQSIRRIYVKEGDVRRIIFMDENPWGIEEHDVSINGSWYNYFTCLGEEEESSKCPICVYSEQGLIKSKIYRVAFLTVLDATGYVSKQSGELVRYRPYLFPMKSAAYELIMSKKRDVGSLVGAVFDCKRVGAMSPAVGNVFDYVGHIEDLKDEELYHYDYENKKRVAPVPFDYSTVLAPISHDEMLKMVNDISGVKQKAKKNVNANGSNSDNKGPEIKKKAADGKKKLSIKDITPNDLPKADDDTPHAGGDEDTPY